MNEFFITAFSNSNNDKYNNTLTSFENDLPKNFNLSENWYVTLQSVGFSTDFKNMLLPKYKTVPDIIICKEPFNTKSPIVDNNNVIIDHSEWHKHITAVMQITFPNQYISVQDMKSEFEKVKAFGLKLDFIVEEYTPYRIEPTFNCELDETHDYYDIFFHENIVESLSLSLYYGGEKKPDKKAKKCFLQGEIYYVYQIKYDYEAIESLNDNWKVKYPDIIKIKCDQIQEQIFNNNYSQDLAILKLKFNPDQKYYIHESDNEHYVRLSNTSLNKVKISLTDKYNRQLNLKRGVSSFARLKFKKMNSDNFFNVRAYSDFRNPNNFTFDIPQQLYLDSEWNVALTSMHYTNKFKPLSYEEKDRTIYTTSIINNELGPLDKYILPNLMFTSVNELITLTHNFISKSIGGKLTLMSPNDINGALNTIFFLKNNTALFIPLTLAEIFGFEIETNKSEYILPIKNNLGLIAKDLETTEDPTKYMKFSFTGLPNINALKPLYFMVYSDIITPCIVGSSYANLLKIIPIESSQELNKIQEFKHKEFHSLESTLLNKININIRSNDGNLINFDDNSKVFLNLLFVRK